LRALLGELRDLLHLKSLTVNGKTLGENLEGARIYNAEVIRKRNNPLKESGGLVVVKGNLAPNGAVIKAAATSIHKHTGKAVVFDDYNDMAARIDRDDLAVDKDSVLVLRNSGPLGGPGMPEWGMLPVPKKLLKQGVRDMVRVSDARMSGTSYGCCVLHVAPESYVGGPLAFVKDGDLIELDINKKVLNLKVDDAELSRRKAAWKKPEPRFERSYGAIFSRHVKQADEGCDFDFLEGTAPVAEPEIH
jgi:dihydroxy-acid dehydratase